MIRILRHGDKRTIECKECGCVFSFEKEDVTIEQTGVNEHDAEERKMKYV